MKKLEIKTEKANLLVVDDSQWDGCIHEFIGINYPNYKHLGKPSEITEDVWKGIVDTGVDFVRETTHFIDYLDESSLYRSAYMSGLSLLKANGVITGNKYQDYWDELCIWGHGDFSKDGKSSYDLYMEEAEKVWKNPHIFIKID